MIRVSTYQLAALVCVRVEHVPSGAAVEVCRMVPGWGRLPALMAARRDMEHEAVAALSVASHVEGERRAAA